MTAVIIPTKDDERVFRVIETVKEENPEEILIVNSGSSEERYSQRLQSIEGVTYLKEDEGAANARNIGAEAAESDKILFLDSDCYPEEDWLARMEDGLEDADIVEGQVDYIGARCPFNRVIENKGEENRFLTANLGVRAEVFEDLHFDTEYRIFREDTDFGWRALQEGYNSEFVDAAVKHDAGRHTFSSFVRERLRYVSEPYFVDKFQDFELLDTEVNKSGPVLYPIELVASLALILSIAGGALSPMSWALTVAIVAGLSTYYTVSKMKENDGRFCPLDWIRGIWYVPTGLLAKRYAIWKGAIKYNVLVV